MHFLFLLSKTFNASCDKSESSSVLCRAVRVMQAKIRAVSHRGTKCNSWRWSEETIVRSMCHETMISVRHAGACTGHCFACHFRSICLPKSAWYIIHLASWSSCVYFHCSIVMQQSARSIDCGKQRFERIYHHWHGCLLSNGSFATWCLFLRFSASSTSRDD